MMHVESVASLELKDDFPTSQKFLRSIEKYCEVEKLNELLPFSEHESADIDYKLHLDKNNPKSWAKSIVAFSNGEGGCLAIGADNDGNVCRRTNPTIQLCTKPSILTTQPHRNRSDQASDLFLYADAHPYARRPRSRPLRPKHEPSLRPRLRRRGGEGGEVQAIRHRPAGNLRRRGRPYPRGRVGMHYLSMKPFMEQNNNVLGRGLPCDEAIGGPSLIPVTER